MNIPTEKTNNLLDVTIELGKDKKMKVVRKVVGFNLQTPRTTSNHATHSIGECSRSDEDNPEEGIEIYLDYFRKNYAKFEETNLYIVHTQADIREKMEEVIADVMNLTNVKYNYAYCLLKSYNFNSNILIEDWFRDSMQVLTKAGLNHLYEEELFKQVETDEETPRIIGEVHRDDEKWIHPLESKLIEKDGSTIERGKYLCPVLLSEYDMTDTYALRCGHRYSKECWAGYLKTSVESEFEEDILNKQCINGECKVFVKKNDWKILCDEMVYKRYKQVLLNIYIRTNPNLSKCPNGSCEYVVELLTLDEVSSNTNGRYNRGSTPLCRCGYQFCFACSRESHRPVTCIMVDRWNDLLKKDDNNVAWMKIHTKRCPSCYKSIEKASGCMKVKCICGFSFCWLCLEKWTNHKGGFYKCNKYIENKKEGNKEGKERGKEMIGERVEKSAEEKEKERAEEKVEERAEEKVEERAEENVEESMGEGAEERMGERVVEKRDAHFFLKKYNHYKTRFDAHEHGEHFSIKTQLLFLHRFCKESHIDVHKMKTFLDAIIQTIKCRQILKWSYAYSYFANWKDDNKKYFFEYHQGELEKNLDILQRKMENINIFQMVKSRDDKTERQVEDLTKAVHMYFKNFCQFVEGDLTC
ncbi:IBR domain protein, putative [Plasmodium ovale curtisi]|uniref:RBR-type E3 ubiquitin transferase n=1 Tax=Plasmodium ovale curtisi TaxID=864141 RepID=A0A1A8WDI3_PLAOA|nr:IBR domain protein, putative [Plasmodium ovale curtisi]